jgi:hypothetical protein
MNGGGIDDPDGAELLCRELGKATLEDGFRESKYGVLLYTRKPINF